MRYDFVISTKTVYLSFETDIETLRTLTPMSRTDIPIEGITKAAYLKTYDFIRYLTAIENPEHAFFHIPMLRSICEDLIAIKFIVRQEVGQRNYLIIKKQYDDINRTLQAQNAFLKKNNPGQIVATPNALEPFEQIIKKYLNDGCPITQTEYPKIFKMASAVGLEEVYTFIYHTTSKAVHFDTFSLLGMGWGEANESITELGGTVSYKHNFYQYFTFILFYSSYLFIQQSIHFDEILNLSKSITDAIAKLEADYANIDWPQWISAKQLNLEEPTDFQKLMHRTMHLYNKV